jgi:hypothetical protein
MYIVLFGVIGAVAAGTSALPEQMPAKPAMQTYAAPSSKSVCIDPKARAMDFQQAFELLRKEKTANKVQFVLDNGKTISNIVDIVILSNGSMILFKINSQQGIKYEVVPVENIESISHS